MKKVIAIFGAGSGLAASVARQYGAKGFAVALVARNAEKLNALAESIRSNGVDTATFIADLSDAEAILSAIVAIRERFGRIDALYYAPNPQDTFTPATELTPAILQPRINLYFYGLINVINVILPEFRERGEGIILSAFGGTAQVGCPFMSGLGPAMAAARNYLQSLQKELVIENIKVGVVTITAIVQNSATHQELQSQDGMNDLVMELGLSEVDPDHLAILLDDALNNTKILEMSFPVLPHNSDEIH
ncbi:SDR family NAD(P)-dependent oxidoreductase [Serratia sp. 22264]|uniref:SDR family NAD(P)-dependent oxidoreductase n=1 Tax=Serratia sp. 22264 TaxID=3453897 RepID=UPI003F83341F